MTANSITLPREIADGVVWMADCLRYHYKGEEWHSHVSAFLISGEDRTLLVDTGHPAHWPVIERALDAHLGDRQLDLVFPTHSEMPHAGNLPRLVTKYPRLEIVGDVRDYHLYYPELDDKLTPAAAGQAIDLGGRTFTILQAIWRDLPSTLWAYDSLTRCMFVADGFAYSHHHFAGECALFSSELPNEPDVEQTMFVNERALFWTRHVDAQRSIQRLERMLSDNPTELVAPAHGSVINNLNEMLPIMYAGMDAQRTRARSEAVT